ncbi:hypothetical protein ACWEWI_22025 [Streptomyces sp. NPDC003753]
MLGPDNLPAITDPDEAARDLPVSVFSALTHAKDPALPAKLDALATALTNTGGETAADWAEYTEIGLGDAQTRELWRQLMTTRTSRFPGSGTLIEETRLKGKVEDILRILDLRGIDVPEATRERIATCTDLDTLSTWFDRAPTVAHAEELFAQN